MNYPMLQIPSTVDLEPALEFVKQLNAQPSGAKFLALDFSRLQMVRPFGMLVIAHALQTFRDRSPETDIMPIDLPQNDAERYAGHMGFFKACAIDLGKNPGQASGSVTYLPITHKDKPGWMVPGEIKDLGRDLAQKLTQKDRFDPLVTTLAYAFTEVIRNVAEHSKAQSFWYCAQYWPSRDEAEIALIDSGIGLFKSLSDNPVLSPHLTNEREALKYALMPGISGKMYPGKRSNPNDDSENTGFGLYMTYRICNEGGNFFIGSGGAGLYREKGAESRYLDYGLTGVALRLRMKINTLEHYADQYHHLFLQDGERIAKEIGFGYIPSAPRMSTMLDHGFDLPKVMYRKGDRVRHHDKRIGKVTLVEEVSDELLLTILFEDGQSERMPADQVAKIQ